MSHQQRFTELPDLDEWLRRPPMSSKKRKVNEPRALKAPRPDAPPTETSGGEDATQRSASYTSMLDLRDGGPYTLAYDDRNPGRLVAVKSVELPGARLPSILVGCRCRNLVELISCRVVAGGLTQLVYEDTRVSLGDVLSVFVAPWTSSFVAAVCKDVITGLLFLRAKGIPYPSLSARSVRVGQDGYMKLSCTVEAYVESFDGSGSPTSLQTLRASQLVGELLTELVGPPRNPTDAAASSELQFLRATASTDLQQLSQHPFLSHALRDRRHFVSLVACTSVVCCIGYGTLHDYHPVRAGDHRGRAETTISHLAA